MPPPGTAREIRAAGTALRHGLLGETRTMPGDQFERSCDEEGVSFGLVITAAGWPPRDRRATAPGPGEAKPRPRGPAAPDCGQADRGLHRPRWGARPRALKSSSSSFGERFAPRGAGRSTENKKPTFFSTGDARRGYVSTIDSIGSRQHDRLRMRRLRGRRRCLSANFLGRTLPSGRMT